MDSPSRIFEVPYKSREAFLADQAALALDALSRNPRAQRKLALAIKLAGFNNKAFHHKRSETAALLSRAALRAPLTSSVRLQEVQLSPSDDNDDGSDYDSYESDADVAAMKAKLPTAFTEAMHLYTSNFRGPEEPSVAQVARAVRKRVYRLFILTKHDLKEKTVAGMIIVAPYGKCVNVEYCAIDEQAQGRGLGTIMLQLLIDLLETETRGGRRCKLLTLECKKSLVPFYQRVGFVESGLKPNVCEMEEKGKISEVPLFFMGFAVESDCVPTLVNHAAMNRVRGKLFSTVHRTVKHL